MIANDEILGNFTKEDIKTEFNKLKDDEHLLIIVTDYREIHSIKIFKSYTLDFEYYYLAGARPDSPAAKKPHVNVVIKNDKVEFSFPLMGVLGLKIKKGDKNND